MITRQTTTHRCDWTLPETSALPAEQCSATITVEGTPPILDPEFARWTHGKSKVFCPEHGPTVRANADALL